MSEISLKEHFERLLAAQETSHSLKLESLERRIQLSNALTDKALDKAEEAQAQRNEAQNRWRQSFTELTSRFVERSLYDQSQKEYNQFKEALVANLANVTSTSMFQQGQKEFQQFKELVLAQMNSTHGEIAAAKEASQNSSDRTVRISTIIAIAVSIVAAILPVVVNRH